MIFFLLVLAKHKPAEAEQVECVTSLEKCPSPTYKHGDGFCDDNMNIPECDFDGQDCCRDKIIDYFCKECLCIHSGCEWTISMYTLVNC